MSDYELIEAARRGDPEAFPQLYERYKANLLGYLRGRGIRGEQDRENVAQEVWLGVSQVILKPREAGGYDPEIAGFYTWMIKFIAQYRVRDWWEDQGKVHPTSGTVEDEEDESNAEPAARPDPVPGDDIRVQMAASTELFRLFWQCGGYPHEQIAFTFAKLIYGGESERGTEGSPQRVDREHGAERLGTLMDECWTRYASVSGITHSIPTQYLRQCMEPARIRLTFTAGALIRPLPDHMCDLKDRPTGGTCLREYYSSDPMEDQGNPTHPISYWCVRVEQKVRHVLGLPVNARMDEDEMDEAMQPLAHHVGEWPIDTRTCARCKLRFVRPCAGRKRQSVARGGIR